MTSSLTELVRSGAPTRGTFLNMGSALAAEVCALAGFDWLLVDLEHGAGGEEGLVGQLLAGASHDVPVLVRVESAERIRVGHALDLGAAGVMFPRLDGVDEVAAAIAHLWYPPRGDRGIATNNRGRRFGTDTRDAVRVSDEVLGVVQIETSKALDDVEAIAATPGVDVLFVGPSDLSNALGVAGQLDSAVFRAALDRVVHAANANQVAAGVLASDVARAAWYGELGFRFIGVGSDSTLLYGAASAAASK